MSVTNSSDPATFRFVARCLSQLRHRVPHNNDIDTVSGTTLGLTFIFLISYHEESQHEGLRNYVVGAIKVSLNLG
jgi:hypothetical protein